MQIHRDGVGLFAATLGMLCLAGRVEAQTNELLVTVTGTVISGQDSDSSGIFGFGVSPTASQPQGTAAGQPVTMTFTLNLAQIPPDACANNACFNTNRAYYFANQVPATNWITATDTIGGHTVPKLGSPGGNPTTGPASPSFAQLWTAYGTFPVYNELDVQSSQTDTTINPLGGGAYQETVSTDASFLRIDSVTIPFLNGLSLNQSFSWNPSENDGLSIGQIEIDSILATCTAAGVCTYTSTLSSAGVGVDIESVTVRKVPEPAALGLMCLALAGLGFVRRRRPTSTRLQQRKPQRVARVYSPRPVKSLELAADAW
jgi:hypothetical protein